ncbi:hypothetical protein EVAR_64075_1 [Eumeta japonica]|uniref:Uncharacterized protein n=1 Tax=Eumeta variegata TaxID=151549 RepID=A0A4C1ZFV8_EUMVA|nr:hypothetical protein EVAR_64075_1 [Eumeta japonica]
MLFAYIGVVEKIGSLNLDFRLSTLAGYGLGHGFEPLSPVSYQSLVPKFDVLFETRCEWFLFESSEELFDRFAVMRVKIDIFRFTTIAQLLCEGLYTGEKNLLVVASSAIRSPPDPMFDSAMDRQRRRAPGGKIQ